MKGIAVKGNAGPTLRERAAIALGVEPSYVYMARPGSGGTMWRVGNGYRYKGCPYFVSDSPVGTGATMEFAVADLEAKCAARAAE